MNDDNHDEFDLHRALHETDFSDESRLRGSLRQRLLSQHGRLRGASSASANHRNRFDSVQLEDNEKMEPRRKETNVLNIFALGIVALAFVAFIALIGVGVLLSGSHASPGAGGSPTTEAANLPSPTSF